MLDPEILSILRCPISGSPLHDEQEKLISQDGNAYSIDDGVINFVVNTEPKNQKVEDGYSAIAESRYDKLVKSAFLMKLLWGIDLAAVPAITEFSGQIPDGLILDVPCGTGAFENELYLLKPEATFLSVDYTMEMIRVKKLKCEKMGIKNVVFIRADVSQLPFKENSLDACISLNGLHVFPDPAKAAKEIGRCLKRDAFVTASVVCSKIRKTSDILMKYLMIPRGIYMNNLPFSDYRDFFEASCFGDFNTLFQTGSLMLFHARKNA